MAQESLLLMEAEQPLCMSCAPFESSDIFLLPLLIWGVCDETKIPVADAISGRSSSFCEIQHRPGKDNGARIPCGPRAKAAIGDCIELTMEEKALHLTSESARRRIDAREKVRGDGALRRRVHRRGNGSRGACAEPLRARLHPEH